MRRRVTRRLTMLQIMCNVLKYRKILETLRCGCGAVAFIFSIYLKPVLYQKEHIFFRKGAFDSISASYHRVSLSIIETDPKFEILQLDLLT